MSLWHVRLCSQTRGLVLLTGLWHRMGRGRHTGLLIVNTVIPAFIWKSIIFHQEQLKMWLYIRHNSVFNSLEGREKFPLSWKASWSRLITNGGTQRVNKTSCCSVNILWLKEDLPSAENKLRIKKKAKSLWIQQWQTCQEWLSTSNRAF